MPKFSKSFRPLAVAFLVLVSFSACVEVRSTDAAPGTVSDAVLAAPAVVRAGDWNRFQVQIPSLYTAGPLRKSRWNAADKIFVETAFLPAVPGRTFVDADVLPGEVYLYEWGAMKNGSFEGAGRARLAIPLDLQVTRDVTGPGEDARKLFATERFGHLIFKNVTVETGGINWLLQAESVSFDQTVIRSFAAGARSVKGDGRSGGQLHLRTPVARGEVRFEMRGENGADGSDGRLPDATLKGRAGLNGKEPLVQDAGSCPRGSMCHVYRCVHPPEDGHPGSPGQRGFAGERGGHGGDTGRVILEIQDRSDLRFAIDFSPGRADSGDGAAPVVKVATAANQGFPLFRRETFRFSTVATAPGRDRAVTKAPGGTTGSRETVVLRRIFA